MRVESTLDDFDMQEIQKRKFEAIESTTDTSDAY